MSGYDFESIGSDELTTKNILNKISEIRLWRYYIGQDFKPGDTIKAPYREDKNPSFSIFFSERKEKYLCKDFANGFSGDIFDYLQMYFNTDFYSTLVKINLDFNMGFKYNPEKYKLGNTRRIITNTVDIRSLDKFEERTKSNSKFIQINQRIFTENDYQYWESYGISRNTLRKYNVYAINRMYINKKLTYSYNPNNPGYAYYFPNSKHFKCYFPLSKELRFIGNIDNFQDIQGYYQCDVKSNRTDKLLILTKSMKDCMLLCELGYDAMAIHGETHRFDEDFIRHIKKYYSMICSLYDRDESGIRGAKQLWKAYQIYPFFIGKNYETKDITDMYKKHGHIATDRFLKTIRRFFNNRQNKSYA